MKTESYFKTHDNHRLYYQAYHTAKPKAILVFVHGLNEHIGRYEHVVERFRKDFTIYLFDQRGHGHSDGVRAYVEKFSDYILDLTEFIKLVQKESHGHKIFLIAHSMGGQVALNYLASRPQTPLSGFVTSSANIKIAWTIHPIKKAIALKLSQFAPKFKLPREINAKWVARNPDIVKAFLEDPMVCKHVTVQLAKEILANQDVILDQASKIKLPALMLHAGDDRISAKAGTEEFFERLSSKDKTLKIYPGFYHEIFNDIENEAVFADIEEWLWERAD